jgi:serine/threonine protein kinase
MTLAAGTKLGPYEIQSPLGAGGMGEVYRAKDPRLGREVAIKVLPASFSQDADRLRRFEQEAKAAGVLNHPNITAVYDIGQHDGAPYVVQELLEGETLRAGLAGGRFSSRRAIDYSLQIANGLAAAHEKGIVHRDLKPENLFVTKDGRVKILDFGLAKLTHQEEGGQATNLPTASAGTEPGVVMGTLGYMSPEQVKGKSADARSDIFSFGAVLYEMLSGRRAFHGESAAETISAILREEPPDLSVTNQSISPGLERIVRHSIEKNPEQRFHSAHDVAFAIESLATDSAARPAAPGVAPSRFVKRRALFLASAAALLLVSFFAGRLSRRPPQRPSLLFERLTSEPGVERSPALSPDGESVAYVKTVAGRSHVLVQRVGSDKPIDLSTDSPASDSDPVFSPDGALIAFRSERDGGGLFVMGPLGESVRRVTDSGFGPDFTPDGKEIVYAEEAATSPRSRYMRSHIWAVELATGKKRLLFGPDAIEPSVSPHGLRVAFWGLKGETAQRDVYTVPLAGLREGDKPVPVTNDPAVDFSPFWSADGVFLYFGSDRGGSLNLWRVPIDEASGQTRGAPEPVTLPVTWAGVFPGAFRGSRGGKRIAFTAPAELRTIEKLVLEPRSLVATGTPSVLRRSSEPFVSLSISPDGSTLATYTIGRVEDLCLISSDGLRLRRLTHDAFRNREPTFTADGKRIVFYSDRGGDYAAYSIAVDGSDVRPLTPKGSPFFTYPHVSPDGRFLAITSSDDKVAVYPLSAGQGGEPTTGPLIAEFSSRMAWAWSPDSRQLLAAAPAGQGLLRRVVLCSLETKKCEELGIGAFSGQFTPDGRTVLFAAADGIRALDLASRASRLLYAIPDSSVRLTIALSRDGRALFFLKDVTEADIWVGTFR